MVQETFLTALQEEARTFTEAIATQQGDWIIKGFIDIFQRIYTISVDTKVVSKVLELLLFPKLLAFADRHDYKLVLAPEQNFYPDLTFVSNSNAEEKYAVDLKSTYCINQQSVNGMTLGAFTGYFRERASKKNTTFSYQAYKDHIVLGIIYSKCEEAIDERRIYELKDLEKISSVIKDFTFFAQPKYMIASSRPGSGNTKNIGSVTLIEQLLHGSGPFAELGEHVYDDYWMYYLTNDMAKAAEINRPYYNLKTYAEYKQLGATIDSEKVQRLETIDTGPGQADADAETSIEEGGE
ncbi:MAG: type II restriction endonuclease [Ktedonobacteraceae bacterium]